MNATLFHVYYKAFISSLLFRFDSVAKPAMVFSEYRLLKKTHGIINNVTGQNSGKECQ